MKLPEGIKENRLANNKRSYKVTIYGGYDPVTNKKIREYKTFATAQEAIDYQQERQVALKKGYNMKFGTMEFSDAFNLWVKTYKTDVSPASWKSYGYTYRKIKETFPKVKLSELSRSMIQSRLNDLGKKGYSHESQRKLLNRIKQFTRAMIYEGALERDPAIDIRLNGHRGKPNSEKFWEVETYRTAIKKWEAVKVDEENADFYLIMLTAVQTGMRLGEIIGLSFDHLKLDNDIPIIEVRQLYVVATKKIGPVKTPSSVRDVPIPDRLVNKLRQWKRYITQVNFASGYRDSENLVFRNANHVMPHEDGVGYRFRRFQETELHMDITNIITFHGLRHTYLTYLITVAKMDA